MIVVLDRSREREKGLCRDNPKRGRDDAYLCLSRGILMLNGDRVCLMNTHEYTHVHYILEERIIVMASEQNRRANSIRDKNLSLRIRDRKEKRALLFDKLR